MASELKRYDVYGYDEAKTVIEESPEGALVRADEALTAIAAIESERDQWKARAESNKPPAGHIIDDQGVVRKVSGKLRVTIDGAVFADGAKAWLCLDSRRAVMLDDELVMGIEKEMTVEVAAYSTREAAEQAREGGKHG